MGAIVLVEDNATDVALAMRAFRRHRLDDVVVLRDGAEALDYLRERPPEELPKVVLLDLKMPKVDGWEVLRELRAEARTETLPVVVLSSSNRSADVREAYRLGANSFVRKRFEARQPGEYLVDVVRYWLGLNCVAR